MRKTLVVAREVLLGKYAQGSFIAGDRLAQVRSLFTSWQVRPRGAQVVLGHGPLLREVLLGEDAQRSFIAGDCLAQVRSFFTRWQVRPRDTQVVLGHGPVLW